MKQGIQLCVTFMSALVLQLGRSATRGWVFVLKIWHVLKDRKYKTDHVSASLHRWKQIHELNRTFTILCEDMLSVPGHVCEETRLELVRTVLFLRAHMRTTWCSPGAEHPATPWHLPSAHAPAELSCKTHREHKMSSLKKFLSINNKLNKIPFHVFWTKKHPRVSTKFHSCLFFPAAKGKKGS